MYEIYEELLAKHGVTTADVSRATGIRQSTISTWKKRNSILSTKYAKLIAEYFGVSIDYLMTGTNAEYISTSKKKYVFDDRAAEIAQRIYKDKRLVALIENFEKLSDTHKDMICGNVETLAGSPQYILKEKRKSSTSQVG